MARKLSTMTWAEMQQEMSIAGSPEKIAQLGKDILELIGKTIDMKTIPEIENTQLALNRISAEMKLWAKMQRNRQTIKNNNMSNLKTDVVVNEHRYKLELKIPKTGDWIMRNKKLHHVTLDWQSEALVVIETTNPNLAT